MANPSSHSFSQTTIPPVEILWSLYQSQPKKVQKAFRKRLEDMDMKEKTKRKMKEYEHALSPSHKEAVHQLVNSVKKGIEDVEENKNRITLADFLEELKTEV